MSENLILSLINGKQLSDTEMYKLKSIFNMLVVNKNYNYNLDDFVNKYHNGNKEEKIELLNNELFEDLKKDNFFHKYYQNYKELLTDEAYCLNHENNYKFIGNSLVFSHQKTDVNFVDRMSYMDKIINYDNKKLNNKKRIKI